MRKEYEKCEHTNRRFSHVQIAALSAFDVVVQEWRGELCEVGGGRGMTFTQVIASRLACSSSQR